MGKKKDVVRYRCINFGACAKADANEIIEFPAIDVLGGTPPCPCCKQNTLQELPPKKPKWPVYVAIGVAVLAVLGGGGYGFYSLRKSPTQKEVVVKDTAKISPVGNKDTAKVVTKPDSIGEKIGEDIVPAKPEKKEKKKTTVVETKMKPVKVNPNPNGSVNLGYGVYYGDTKDGKPHGYGKIVFKRIHRIISSKDYVANPGDTYEGEFRNGQPSGGMGYWQHDGDITAIKP